MRWLIYAGITLYAALFVGWAYILIHFITKYW